MTSIGASSTGFKEGRAWRVDELKKDGELAPFFARVDSFMKTVTVLSVVDLIRVV